MIGRIDTAAGQRVYVGTMPQAISLFDIGTLILPVDRAESLGLWSSSGTPSNADVVLLRHLVVDGWRITASRDEFDNRRAQVRTRPPAKDAAEPDPWGLRTLRAAAHGAATVAAASLDSGEPVPSEALDALQDWNRSLSDAAADVGLLADGVTIESVLGAMKRRAQAWDDQMSEVRGRRQALERLDAAIELGGLAARHLTTPRAEIAESLSDAMAQLLAASFMDANGGSSAGGAVWLPAKELSRRYVAWRADHRGSPPTKDVLSHGLQCEQLITDALWATLVKVDKELASTEAPDPQTRNGTSGQS